MNIEQIRATTRKDFIELLYSRNEVKMIYLQLIIPSVIMPIVVIYLASILEAVLKINIEKNPGEILQYFLDRVYPWLIILGSTSVSISTITDSIAGEKERKTFERLLSTPVDESTLLLGKSIASWLYSYIPTMTSFILFMISANIFSSILINHNYIFPSPKLIFVLLVLSPILRLTLIGIGIIVSIKTKTMREAMNIGGFISSFALIPVGYGLMKDSTLANFLIISLIVGMICTVIFLFAWRIFNREDLIKYT